MDGEGERVSMDKKLVYENLGVKVYNYKKSGNYEYVEIHVGGRVITVESLTRIGVYVR